MRDILTAAARAIELCRVAGLRIVTAESCTGGLISGALTEIPGSSAVLDRGFVTYSNRAKVEMLGVPPELIEAKGAVSEEVARAMAAGALANSSADIVVSVTGVAGPGGGTPSKPVGLVYIAVQRRGQDAMTLENRFPPDASRETIRGLSVYAALRLVIEAVEGPEQPQSAPH